MILPPIDEDSDREQNQEDSGSPGSSKKGIKLKKSKISKQDKKQLYVLPVADDYVDASNTLKVSSGLGLLPKISSNSNSNKEIKVTRVGMFEYLNIKGALKNKY